MPNIKPFSLFPTLSDNLLSNRFDQIDRLFSQLTGSKPIASPVQTYNLKQIDDNHYELTVSVPGYQENDLTVSLKGSRLLIEGKKKKKNQKKTMINGSTEAYLKGNLRCSLTSVRMLK